MTYEKPKAEVITFDFNSFIVCSGDTPLGSFTCGTYTQGGSCSNISWSTTGYTCGSYTNGNCQLYKRELPECVLTSRIYGRRLQRLEINMQ